MVNLHVLYDTTILAFYTERINSKSITILLLGERTVTRKEVRGQSPPAPVEGVFCINYILIGGQQARHTDKDREEQMHNIPISLTNL
jgi:hypothetical protein